VSKIFVKAYFMAWDLKNQKGGVTMKRKNKMVVLSGVFCLVLTLGVLPFGSVHVVSAQVKTVKIGCSEALNLSWGVDIKEALELCVDIINREGGLKVGKDKYKIEMIIYDDKYRADTGQAAAQRLVNVDRVKAVVGTAASSAAVGSLPVIQTAGIPLFSSAHTEKILDPKLKFVYATSTARSVVDALYPLILKTEPKIKTAVLAAQDDETGHALTEKATSVLKVYGIKILDSFYFPRTQRDYTPIATKLASLNADFFAIPGFGGAAETTGLMAKALHDSPWRGAWSVTASPVIKDLVGICPRGEADGLYIPLTDFTTMSEPPKLSLKVRKAFEEKYGAWREVGPYWTLPLWFFAAAVEKAGSFDPGAIEKAMVRLEVETPIGKARMFKRPDLGNMKFVDAMVTPVLSQVRGGKAAFVQGMTIDEAIKAMEKVYGFKGQWE
jgi:branched-chain amino acid transport system substrate-binding protein